MNYLNRARYWKRLPDERLARVLEMIDREATVLLDLLGVEEEPAVSDVTWSGIHDLFDRWPLEQITSAKGRIEAIAQIGAIMRVALATMN